MRSETTRRLCYVGLLTALQIIFSRYVGFQTAIVHPNFGFLPLMVTAIWFGVWPAVISAGISDVISFLLYGGGSFFPGFTLNAMLCGLVYGLLLYNKPRSLWRIGLSAVITSLGIGLLLGTYWVQVLTGKAFWALLPPRIVQSLVMIPIKVVTVWLVAYRLPAPQSPRQA